MNKLVNINLQFTAKKAYEIMGLEVQLTRFETNSLNLLYNIKPRNLIDLLSSRGSCYNKSRSF